MGQIEKEPNILLGPELDDQVIPTNLSRAPFDSRDTPAEGRIRDSVFGPPAESCDDDIAGCAAGA